MNKIFNIDLILKEEKESYQPLTWQEMDSNMKILQNTINKLGTIINAEEEDGVLSTVEFYGANGQLLNLKDNKFTFFDPSGIPWLISNYQGDSSEWYHMWRYPNSESDEEYEVALKTTPDKLTLYGPNGGEYFKINEADAYLRELQLYYDNSPILKANKAQGHKHISYYTANGNSLFTTSYDSGVIKNILGQNIITSDRSLINDRNQAYLYTADDETRLDNPLKTSINAAGKRYIKADEKNLTLYDNNGNKVFQTGNANGKTQIFATDTIKLASDSEMDFLLENEIIFHGEFNNTWISDGDFNKIILNEYGIVLKSDKIHPEWQDVAGGGIRIEPDRIQIAYPQSSVDMRTALKVEGNPETTDFAEFKIQTPRRDSIGDYGADSEDIVVFRVGNGAGSGVNMTLADPIDGRDIIHVFGNSYSGVYNPYEIVTKYYNGNECWLRTSSDRDGLNPTYTFGEEWIKQLIQVLELSPEINSIPGFYFNPVLDSEFTKIKFDSNNAAVFQVDLEGNTVISVIDFLEGGHEEFRLNMPNGDDILNVRYPNDSNDPKYMSLYNVPANEDFIKINYTNDRFSDIRIYDSKGNRWLSTIYDDYVENYLHSAKESYKVIYTKWEDDNDQELNYVNYYLAGGNKFIESTSSFESLQDVKLYMPQYGITAIPTENESSSQIEVPDFLCWDLRKGILTAEEHGPILRYNKNNNRIIIGDQYTLGNSIELSGSIEFTFDDNDGSSVEHYITKGGIYTKNDFRIKEGDIVAHSLSTKLKAPVTKGTSGQVLKYVSGSQENGTLVTEWGDISTGEITDSKIYREKVSIETDGEYFFKSTLEIGVAKEGDDEAALHTNASPLSIVSIVGTDSENTTSLEGDTNCNIQILDPYKNNILQWKKEDPTNESSQGECLILGTENTKITLGNIFTIERNPITGEYNQVLNIKAVTVEENLSTKTIETTHIETPKINFSDYSYIESSASADGATENISISVDGEQTLSTGFVLLKSNKAANASELTLRADTIILSIGSTQVTLTETKLQKLAALLEE